MDIHTEAAKLDYVVCVKVSREMLVRAGPIILHSKRERVCSSVFSVKLSKKQNMLFEPGYKT